MKITGKNLIIIMIMIFLIFNHFVGLAWEIVKTIIYSILFLYLLSFISPDLYETILNLLNLKGMPFQDVFTFVTNSIMKVKSYIPILNKMKIGKKEEDDEVDEEINYKIYEELKKGM
tara:strand:- start:142 stop:492 length:351 start_codon:yes stop_codon:yes gene_type:complete